MIIDLILDRKEEMDTYSPHKFYIDCSKYGDISNGITRALDYGTEKDVKKALCKYIVDNNYNLDICNYINSVKWLR